MGISIKKNTRSAELCADQIDVMTNFAVITNVVIKRVHCIPITDMFIQPITGVVVMQLHQRLELKKYGGLEQRPAKSSPVTTLCKG